VEEKERERERERRKTERRPQPTFLRYTGQYTLLYALVLRPQGFQLKF